MKKILFLFLFLKFSHGYSQDILTTGGYNGSASATSLTGVVPIVNGGTNSSTANGGLNNLLPSQTGNSGKYLKTDGTVASWDTPAGAGTVTSIATGYGVSGGTITSSGTIIADTTSSGGLVSKVRLSHPSAYPTLNQSTTGNAATATALQNARTINGTSFDGTGNITVTAAGSTLTGSSLASGITSSSLTSFGDSPTFTTPNIGVATATTINKISITQPASSGTLTIANGKVLASSNSLTLAGTDATTMTFPNTSATIARTDAGNTFTGHQTIEGVTSTGAVGTGDLTFSDISINTPTATYTLVLTDKSKLIRMNVASSNNLTVPPNSSVAFPIGSQILISEMGAGQTTFVAGSGVTINSSNSKLKISGQHSVVALIKVATDTWLLFGDLTL